MMILKGTLSIWMNKIKYASTSLSMTLLIPIMSGIINLWMLR